MTTVAARRGRRYPAAMAVRARALASVDGGGWHMAAIVRILTAEFGVTVSKDTVRRWTKFDAAERARKRAIDNRYRRRVRPSKFRLAGGNGEHGFTPEFRAEFVRALRLDGVPRRSILRVCRRVIAPDFTAAEVRVALGENQQRERAA